MKKAAKKVVKKVVKPLLVVAIGYDSKGYFQYGCGESRSAARDNLLYMVFANTPVSVMKYYEFHGVSKKVLTTPDAPVEKVTV